MSNAVFSFRASVLKRATMEEKDIPQLAFNQAVVIRTPLLWLLIFEERAYSVPAFRGKDGEPGSATRAFLHGCALVFSGMDEDADDPVALDGEQQIRAQRLAAVFASVGTLYATIPLTGTTPVTKQKSLEALFTILRPQLSIAKRTLEEMNAAFLMERGGDADRFLACRVLDPGQFAIQDRDAIKKATVRESAPIFGGKPRKRTRQGVVIPGGRDRVSDKDAVTAGGGAGGQAVLEVCRKCKKTFPKGRFLQHRRSGECK